mgnify:CR=1 FL=1
MTLFTRIVTHWGPFHADDVLSVAVLRTLAPEAKVVRTRDPALLREAAADPATALVDVGHVSDPALNNFDHHQADFSEARPDGVPYASIGLVWRTWGLTYVRRLLEGAGGSVPDEAVAFVHGRVDRRLIACVDAYDCGAVRVAAHVPRPDGRDAGVYMFTVSDLVAALVPASGDEAALAAAFEGAVEVAERALRDQVAQSAEVWRFLAQVREADDGGPVLCLPVAGPWREHVLPHHRCVVFPAPGASDWLAQVVTEPDDVSFPPRQRASFPASWGGAPAERLRELTGVADVTFCHRALFIAGAQSRDGALRLARQAVALAP